MKTKRHFHFDTAQPGGIPCRLDLELTRQQAEDMLVGALKQLLDNDDGLGDFRYAIRLELVGRLREVLPIRGIVESANHDR